MARSKEEKLFDELKKAYPDAHCELQFTTPFELLIATILSAQCTDKRVNEVTRALFNIANEPEDFASMKNHELEKMIYSCGFYKNKAKSIIACSREILQRHNGIVPADMNALVSLTGVGRKTANVVMANAFGGNNIAVDTHVYRTAKRLGLSNGKTPFDVEKDLMRILKESEYSISHHLLIFHGRYCCKSQNPECYNCPVQKYCKYIKE